MEVLNYDVMYQIMDYMPYETLMNFSKTSKRHRIFVKQFLASLALRLRQAIGAMANYIGDRELIERVYFLNNYQHNSPTDILITGNTVWKKGNNLVTSRKQTQFWGTLVHHSWMSDGMFWRIGGPALIERYSSSIVKVANATVKGGPYEVKGYYPNGRINYIRRGFNGQLHGYPALSIYSDDDVPDIELSYYYNNGVLHNIHGPAVDSQWFKKWYINGQLHREGGPAAIVYLDDNSKIEQWYTHGQLISQTFTDPNHNPVTHQHVIDEMMEEIPDTFYEFVDPNN